MFDFAWKLNKDDKELLWLAIVALTEQMLSGKIDNTQYTLEVGKFGHSRYFPYYWSKYFKCVH